MYNLKKGQYIQLDISLIYLKDNFELVVVYKSDNMRIVSLNNLNSRTMKTLVTYAIKLYE